MNKVTQSFKYTKESAANMVSAIRQWLFFTIFFSLKILPASPDSLICFCEFMARSVSFQHIKHCVHAVQFLHESLNLDFPCDSFQLDMTLQGLKRRLARVAFQVLPITPFSEQCMVVLIWGRIKILPYGALSSSLFTVFLERKVWFHGLVHLIQTKFLCDATSPSTTLLGQYMFILVLVKQTSLELAILFSQSSVTRIQHSILFAIFSYCSREWMLHQMHLLSHSLRGSMLLTIPSPPV